MKTHAVLILLAAASLFAFGVENKSRLAVCQLCELCQLWQLCKARPGAPVWSPVVGTCTNSDSVGGEIVPFFFVFWPFTAHNFHQFWFSEGKWAYGQREGQPYCACVHRKLHLLYVDVSCALQP